VSRAGGREAIVGILNPILEARAYTAFDAPFTSDTERSCIVNFLSRGVWNVSVRRSDGRVVRFQVLGPFGPYTKAFDHVGSLRTYVDLAQRRRGS